MVDHLQSDVLDVHRKMFMPLKLKSDIISEGDMGKESTLRQWKNEKAYARYLVRSYKQRWDVETGFRELNGFHPYFRCRIDVQKWADLFMRGWTYDL